MGGSWRSALAIGCAVFVAAWALYWTVADTPGSARVATCSCDVSQADAVGRLAEETQAAFGGIHVLCNNAGVFAGGTTWGTTLADYEWILGVNVWGIARPPLLRADPAIIAERMVESIRENRFWVLPPPEDPWRRAAKQRCEDINAAQNPTLAGPAAGE